MTVASSLISRTDGGRCHCRGFAGPARILLSVNSRRGGRTPGIDGRGSALARAPHERRARHAGGCAGRARRARAQGCAARCAGRSHATKKEGKLSLHARAHTARATHAARLALRRRACAGWLQVLVAQKLREKVFCMSAGGFGLAVQAARPGQPPAPGAPGACAAAKKYQHTDISSVMRPN